MNTKFYLLPLLLLAVLFASCEETKEVSKYDNWRARNDAFVDSLYQVYTTQPDHGGLDSIHLISAPGQFIFYKKLTPATPDGKEPIITDISPLYTESVSTYYRGSYINGETFDQNFTGANPSFSFDSPSTFRVGAIIVNNKVVPGVVTGFAEMLQRMKVGERRLIYIPWRFGYGESNQVDQMTGKVTIIGTSTLIFDAQLLSIED